MKVWLSAVMLLALIIVGYCIYRTFKEKHKFSRLVRKILYIGAVIMIVNMEMLLAVDDVSCLWGYSIYFVATDWLLYYMLQFSLKYTGKKYDKRLSMGMIILLVIDSISLLLNNQIHHLFSLQEVHLYGGEIYFKLLTTDVFYTHYTIILVSVLACLIVLFQKTFSVAAFYRNKYLVIALALVAIIALNIFTFKSAIDISVIGYPIEAVCIYYCVFAYTPQKLLPTTLHAVAQDMAVALMVMDMDGKYVYSNKAAKLYLKKTVPLLDENGVTLQQWCQEQINIQAEEFEREKTFYKNKEELFFKIQLQKIADGRKQIQGYYFVIQDRTEEILNLRKERYLATHDVLTGLYNKEYFYERAGAYIKEHQEKELFMICTDIRNFKMINDFFGAETGDTVLVKLADMLSKQIKESAIIGRLGNDIFGILMSKEDYRESFFANEVQKAFASCMRENIDFPMINYIGVYRITEPELAVSVMCDRARMAIATIKGDYHKRVAYYDKELRDNILWEQELISELPNAIKSGQIQMYLQPQMDAEGNLLGAEALVRWQHPVKGLIQPSNFIPILEKNGQITDIDNYIWEVACQQLGRWKEAGIEDMYISVNISPKDFYFLDIYQIFTSLVQKYNVNPKNLKLEITESAIMMDFDRQVKLIDRLREAGFIVEMDDFGSGYSSLNMLKDILVDVLKIDMAFLQDAQHQNRNKKILQMIISLSKQLGMPVITEGVENAEQVTLLSQMGCDMFQGFFFAKPMQVQQFEQVYLQNKQHNLEHIQKKQ